ncbi:tetratricopeptide repeat protein [Maribellus sp. YY47]|uniref:tetratricopeptide repeat-containing sensor histidine kinase n=1 Tax=Maribellus sp. YY47 TaxID=2929486 RepID=UPI002000C2E9|nr:tetratricopeptide repeat protein [Maribellus sp. YY47]MCK3685328.1 tetratricopeptide repeat-containing sensor histidine kinase [Maribellus sp. YY47]
MNRIARQYCFLALLCGQVLYSHAYGQTSYRSRIDSLKNEIDSKSAKEAISDRLDLALMEAGSDKQLALQLTKEALAAAQKLGNRKLVMQAYYTLGRVYIEMENYEDSQACMDTALFIVNSLNDDWYKGEILYRKATNNHFLGDQIEALDTYSDAVQACRKADNYKTLGSSYSMMGTIYRMNGLYDRAIEYIIKSEWSYEKAGFKEGKAWSDYLLGRTYADLGLSEEAMNSFQKALEIYKRLSLVDGDRGGEAICYAQIAMLNIASGDYEEALKNIETNREIYEAKGSKFGLSDVYKGLGVLEYSRGNYREAENYLQTALELKNELEETLSLASIYKYMGLCMIGDGQNEEGIRTIRKGLDQAISNDQKKIQLDIYENLTKAYLEIGNHNNAIECQKKQIEIQNLILAGGGNVKASQLSAMYEIDQKNNQIAELEKQNKINALSLRQQQITRKIMISGIILAFLIAGIILGFYRKLKRTNRELHEANAAKDKFFAIISHDLRGPIGTLTSFLQHLSSNFDHFTRDELEETVDVLCKSAENVSQLLENLLVWAKSQAEKMEYRPEQLNLVDCIENVVNDLSHIAGNKEITVSFERKAEILVFADRNMLQTILRNVLSNAIKFTHRGGSVSIQPEIKGKNSVMVRVADTGVGIEKSKIATIFDISSSYHTHGTENEMSTGLGLILVKDFVEKNKGTISIESEQKKGTIVSFTLPAAASVG